MEAPEVLQHLAGLPCTQSVEDGHDVIVLSNALRNREVKITCIANSPSVQVLLLDHSTVPSTVHTDMMVDHSFEMAGMLVRAWIE